MDNVIIEKTFNFAVRITKLRKFLCYDAENKEFDISRQLLRSGTSIGANIEEAQGAQSNSDFLSKVSIAYKEARESRYWIRLLFSSGYLTPQQYNGLMDDIEEICKIISKIIMSTKDTLKK